MGIFMLELSPGALQIKVPVLKLFGRYIKYKMKKDIWFWLSVSLLHCPGAHYTSTDWL